MPQCNVTITPHQERFLEAALQSGQFDNISEVIQTALSLLEREQQQNKVETDIINKKIDKGIESYKAGDYTEIKNQEDLEIFFDGLKKERQQSRKT